MKRKNRAPQSKSGPEEKQISEERRPKGKWIKDHLTDASSTLLSELDDSERVVGSSSKIVTENGTSQRAAFGEDDFIPFDLSSSSDDEESGARSGKDRKGKGKEFEDEARKGGNRDTDPRRGKFSGTSDREWDKGKRQYDREDDRRWSGSRREGDRDRDAKRKYDEYQGDDRDRSPRKRSNTASKKCPWMMGVDLEQCHNVAEMLHCEVESFVDWISPTPIEDEIRGLIVDHIAKAIQNPFPDAHVFPFGSYMTKLYLPTGDIDLVVLSDMMAYNDKTRVLHMIATALKRSGITSHVTIIAKAKVPIVKFISTHGRIQVDISINQGNGLTSGKIITGFLKQMIPSANEKESKALRSLIMITKAFLAQRKLNEVYTGGLGSYSVVCLAVSFLQMHPKIRRGEIDPEKNLGVLVVEFFELYGNLFNYDDVGISLREGGTYFNKRERGWNVDYKRNVLSIEDPADPSNDISSGSYHFHKVRTAFAGAYNILTTTSYNRADILSSRHQGTSFRLRQRYEPEDLSVLSTVMGVTQETINHRRLVQELYDKKTLHRIMGVEPRISVVHHAEVRKRPSGNKPGTSPQNSRAVESAWTNGRSSDESEDEDDYQRRHSKSYDQDGGRYDIGRKKRRKTQRSEESVYFVADKDSKGDLSEGELDGSDDDARDDDGRGSRQGNGTSRHARREFWLGKALKMGESARK